MWETPWTARFAKSSTSWSRSLLTPKPSPLQGSEEPKCGGTPIPQIIIRARMLSGRTRHEVFIGSCPVDTVKTSLGAFFEMPWHKPLSYSKAKRRSSHPWEGLARGQLLELTFLLTWWGYSQSQKNARTAPNKYVSNSRGFNIEKRVMRQSAPENSVKIIVTLCLWDFVGPDMKSSWWSLRASATTVALQHWLRRGCVRDSCCILGKE